MLPSPTDLTYFTEVVKSLNITRAAERLGITQPSLTQALHRLELEVGVPLLFRSKKGVTLTPAGQRLSLQTMILMTQWEKVRGQAIASMDEVQGRFRLGCHPSVGSYALPEVIPGILREYPNLEITLIHQLSRHVFEAVVSMEIDMALVINPPKHPDVIIKKLLRDEMTFWISQKMSDLQNLKNKDAVLIYDPNLLQSKKLIQKIKKQGLVFRREIHTSNLELIAHLTAAGAGVGILPGRVASHLSKNQLKPLSTQAPKFYDELTLVYRVEHKNIKTFKIINQAFSKAFELELKSMTSI